MNMKFAIGVCVVLVVSVIQNGQTRKIPSWLPICKRADPDLDTCWKKTFDLVMSKLDKGIPEMNLRAIDPVEVDKLTIDYGNGTSLSLIAKLSNLKLYGVNKGVLDKATVNLDSGAIGLKMHFPSVHMVADYEATGKILLIPIDSKGPFRGDMTGLSAEGVWHGKRVTKKGKDHFRFDDTTLDLDIKTMNVVMENLFPTSAELTDTTNRAINENIDVLYLELKPIILETIKAVIDDSVNNVYSLFPLDDLYPI